MRFLIPLFVAWSAVAQLPIVPFTVSNPTTTVADYTNNLYADYETDTSSSFTNVTDGAIVGTWFNIGFLQGSTSFDLKSSSAVWPYSTNNVTPTGKPAVDFQKNNGSTGLNAPHWGGSASNQPNTIITCLLIRSNAVQFFFDNSSGGRTFVDVVPNTSFGFFANSGVTINTPTVMSNFFIITAVFNGANSYFRTNGVLLGTGNPSTGPMGVLVMGGDITGGTVGFTGMMCAWRCYAEALSTNNLHTAEQNIATRYLGITLPPP